MKLADLQPKKVDFTVSDVELTFRPFTIADDLKSQEIAGGQKKLVKAFEEFDFEKISLVAWYQLTLESQRKILEVVEAATIDPDTGEETQVNIKPIEKFRALFQGIPDQIHLLTNLVKCRGLNIPNIEDDEALGEWVNQLTAALPSIGG